MRLLAATLRYRMEGANTPGSLPDGPVIFALWHNRLGLCMKIYHRFLKPNHSSQGLAALISASKDGALLAAILDDFKVQPVRGSSSRRGAQALLELSSWAERGYDLAVTPDGPRGPRYVAQEGVVTLAQVTGLPIIPGSYRLNWKIRLKSWDRFQIPLPFSRCDIYLGDPIHIPREASAKERAELLQKLNEVLVAAAGGD
jgi:lysophospholipid acyltransferase (LPLAT)-like uncharacterized protein